MKKAAMTAVLPPEWSYCVAGADIGVTPKRIKIEASEQERSDLCHRLGVDSVESLKGILTLRRDPKSHVVHVEGTFTAAITQPCAVTLEPIRQEIEGPVEGWFVDPEGAISLKKVRHEKQSKAAGTEVEVLDEKDDPEPFVEGQIDLGELMTQHLSLSVNPYIRKEGAAVAEAAEDRPPAAVGRSRQNPFAALKDWKKR